MNIASCALSIIPVRHEPSHRSEMVTQLFFGEELEILAEEKDFAHVRILDIVYDGWVQKKQLIAIVNRRESTRYVVDLSGAIATCGTRKIHLHHGTRLEDKVFTLGQDTWVIDDNEGIFDRESNAYSHKLRIVKRYFTR